MAAVNLLVKLNKNILNQNFKTFIYCRTPFHSLSSSKHILKQSRKCQVIFIKKVSFEVNLCHYEIILFIIFVE